jgi:hypothetical protein
MTNEELLRGMARSHESQARGNRRFPSIAEEHEQFMSACLAGAEALRLWKAHIHSVTLGQEKEIVEAARALLATEVTR